MIAVSDINFEQLAGFLQQTLSPDPNVRRPAEKLLELADEKRNHGVMLLNLIDKSDIDVNIRVAGAIAFKNYIKRNWAPNEDEASRDKIHMDDRNAMKAMIVNVMVRSPAVIQKQLSDAVSIIGKYDFPKKWPVLIDEMLEKFALGDFNVINGILRTAHSLFKRYRYEFKSQELWEEIKFVLDRMAKPLTDLLLATMQLTKVHENNVEALRIIYGSLVLVCKVFLSLNSQDLPEFFEDNMATWMKAFHELITVDVPSLHTGDDEEASVLDHLRSQVCENISLYAQKYDEEFSPYMETFVTAIWELLVKTSIHTKYDLLVSHALIFLTVIAERNHYRRIFENPEILVNICEKVIIPNLDFRQSDEEIFEDSPEEYIRRDIEGSDIDTRRRAASDLVKTLAQNFEDKIFGIFSQYLQLLLNKYKENPTANWRSKDTAIYMVISFASRGSTQKHGVTKTSDLVPLPQFCAEHVMPELERADVNELPVLKAAAIKYIMIFRSLMGQHLHFFPQLIRHLSAKSVVVHSYAACALDALMALRNPQNAPVITKQQLSPCVGELYPALFQTLTFEGSNENEYIMKTIMRTLSCLQEASMPYAMVSLPRLTKMLTIVATNPSKPQFNHYLFESLALSIKIVCNSQKMSVGEFEEVLFPIFQQILQGDVIEFIPYVFQMLTMLLEIRQSCGGGIPEPYWSLFPFLLAPPLWERSSNTTPLIRLLCAYIRQGSAQIVALGKLSALLGIFQKMIASKANDHEGFYLLKYLLVYYPFDELERNIRQVFSLLFQRLSLSKTPKYVRCVIVFFCFYAWKCGASALVELIDSIQTKLFSMVLDRLFVLEISNINSELDRKVVAVGVTKLLTECPAMLGTDLIGFWTPLLQLVIELFEIPPVKRQLEADSTTEAPLLIDCYQTAFSQLNYAQPQIQDFLSEVEDCRKYLANALVNVSKSPAGGQVSQLLAALSDDHKRAVQGYCEQIGGRIF